MFFIVNKSHLFYVPFNLVKIPNDDYGLQLRQPAPGIQNIGMIGSLNASQMRPPAISSPQQPRSGLPSSTTPSPSGNQMPGSQVRSLSLVKEKSNLSVGNSSMCFSYTQYT